MEVVLSQQIDGEEVFVITTLGRTEEEVVRMRREARIAKVQEYVRQFEESQKTVGLHVDTSI